MKKIASILLALAITSPALPQQTTIRFPHVKPSPAAAEVTKLTADTLYVFDSDKPLIVIPGSLGVVSITKYVGPMAVFGRFIDGTGEPEVRQFKGVSIYILQASGAGKFDLIVLPEGGKEADVIRKSLDVDSGTGPKQPPPNPKGAVAHATFVGVTPETVGIVNDADLRARLKASSIKVWLSSRDDFASLSEKSAKAIDDVGAPAIILQDGEGNILGSVRMTTISAAYDFLKPYIGK